MTLDEHGTLERSLAEMLHRLTPEPPRTVTVEDVAIHLANQAAPPRRAQRAFRDGQTAVLHIGKRGRPRFAPALAAASVVAVVGASTGIAVALTSSHHNAKSPTSGGVSASGSATTAGTTPATADTTPPGSSGTHPPQQPQRIAGSLWGAELIVQQSLEPGTLTGGDNSLYALSDGILLRIDPSKNQIVGQVSAQGTGRPVVDGDTVWVAAANGSGMTLSGFNATTLALSKTVAVPGGGLSQPEGALAVGPEGDLYVADGSNVTVVDPGSSSVVRHINVSGGLADSVAVTPDGGTLYAGVTGGGGFRLEAFDTATGASRGGTVMPGSNGGYLIATVGGVWGTTGALMTQRTWFAPGGDLTKVRSVTSGVDGGLDSAPTYVNGTVWIGGIRSLECLDPASGKVRASSQIPSDSGVPEHFGSVAFAAGRAFTTFQDQHVQQDGVAAVNPPAACGTAGTTGS